MTLDNSFISTSKAVGRIKLITVVPSDAVMEGSCYATFSSILTILRRWEKQTRNMLI